MKAIPSAAVLALALLYGAPSRAVTIPTVPVGNPGNPSHSSEFTFLGAVDHRYRIGKYEVTNAEFVEFLNGVDPIGANTLELYGSSMTTNALGGIIFNGGAANGSKYEIKPGRGNNPVLFISWYDALRFANWLHNGQGSGDTETGAYTLLGGTAVPSNGSSITRNHGARWFLPTEDEWYKAAFHMNDGVTGNYWAYPTSTSDTPASDQPPGSDAPVPSNTANFFRNDSVANGYNDGYAIPGSPIFDGSQNYLTDVGSYALTPNPYGTFDQGGNVREWTETIVNAQFRRVRGGSWGDGASFMSATLGWGNTDATVKVSTATGFRIAMVPEPGGACLAMLAGMAVWWRIRASR